ncbi:hypothetical protein GCM10028802_20620 [Terrabacter terrigena]
MPVLPVYLIDDVGDPRAPETGDRPRDSLVATVSGESTIAGQGRSERVGVRLTRPPGVRPKQKVAGDVSQTVVAGKGSPERLTT